MQVADHWQMATIVAEEGDDAMTRCAWGWSDESPEAAMRMALDRAERAARKAIARDRSNAWGDEEWYDYGERFLPEQLLRRIESPEGVLLGAITRNRYGAKILNTPSLAMLDIDRPGTKRWGDGFLGLFFKKRTPADPIEPIRAWAREKPGRGARVYRTRNGLRAFLLGEHLDPTADATQALMKRCSVDPLYARLCRHQSCYRARLTPKPWRIGMAQHPGSTHDEQSPDLRLPSRQWLAEYEQRSAGVAVCELIEEIGTVRATALEAPLIEAHDAVTLDRAASRLA